jgi:hypothetical protein
MNARRAAQMIPIVTRAQEELEPDAHILTRKKATTGLWILSPLPVKNKNKRRAELKYFLIYRSKSRSNNHEWLTIRQSSIKSNRQETSKQRKKVSEDAKQLGKQWGKMTHTLEASRLLFAHWSDRWIKIADKVDL